MANGTISLTAMQIGCMKKSFRSARLFSGALQATYIAYYKFDETDVKEFAFTQFDDKHNKQYNYKYPKAGDANSTVAIHIYNVTNGQSVPAQFHQGDIYIPRIKWTQQDDKLVVYWMNRHQDSLQLLLTDAKTGSAQTMYEEGNKYYVDINDDWWFLKDGKHLLYGSEKDGHYSLYLNSIDGKKSTRIAKMKYDISDVNGVDETNRLVYYTVAYPTPMDRNLFVSDFDGKKTTQLTTGTGWHRS